MNLPVPSVCPKCGNTLAGVWFGPLYVPAFFAKATDTTPEVNRPEHLRYTCNCCQFVRTTPCADAKVN